MQIYIKTIYDALLKRNGNIILKKKCLYSSRCTIHLQLENDRSATMLYILELAHVRARVWHHSSRLEATIGHIFKTADCHFPVRRA